MNDEQTTPRPKNEWLAAVLNFVLPGLGYLYVGSKRQVFNMGLIIGSMLGLLSPALWRAESDAAAIVSGLIIAVAFAVDAFQDTVARNKAL